MAEFKRPNITGKTEAQQLQQIKTYLFQLTGELNFALKDTERVLRENGITSDTSKEKTIQKGTEENNAQKTFSNIKNLIIKSADIVEAYYEVINQRLSGSYVAQSDFGTYKEETESRFTATSTNLTQYYEKISSVESELNNLNELRKDGCYIKTGWLDDDETIAGFEVGVYDETTNGKDVGFARFTTEELAFYDGNGIKEENKLAWFSKYKMYVRDVTIKGILEHGGYAVDPSDGLAWKWVGED